MLPLSGRQLGDTGDGSLVGLVVFIQGLPFFFFTRHDVAVTFDLHNPIRPDFLQMVCVNVILCNV